MSLNVSAILATLASLEKQHAATEKLIATLKEQLGADPSAAKPSVARRAKKESAPRAPTEWRLFADRVRDVLRAAKKDDGSPAYSGTALGVGCVQFCATLKEENADLASWSDADILARRADWSAPAVSKQKAAGKSSRKGKRAAASAAASVASESAPQSDGDAAAAPSDGEAESTSSSKKRGPTKGSKWSDEKKAAAKAKRAANRAAKSSVSNAAGSSVSNAAASVPLPPSPPASVAPTDESAFKKALIGGKAYLVNLETGHAYFRNVDESRGDWAGIFHRTGGENNRPYIESKPAPHTLVDELD